jgi:hypothetical protein
MKKPTGYTIFEGKSPITGDDIIAVITLKSTNIKTGNMASMWILHKDLSPIEASKQGKDESICGMCPHRHNLGGACYVTLFQAPLQVWKSYHKGNYPKVNDMTIFEGMSVRFGAYGDPNVIPIDILVQLKSVVKNSTSYTHQWKTESDNESLKAVSMASVDNKDEAKLAIENGWRYFRVTNDISDINKATEIVCPNTTKGIQCIDCGLCKGNTIKAKNIVIEVHGSKKKKFKE